MQVLTLEKNRGYLIAGIGAIVTLFAFIFLPILSASSTPGGQSTLLNVSNVAQDEISIWIVGLAAATAITIAALIAFRPVPFSMLKTTAPIEIQIQWGNYLLILAGVFGALTPLIIMFTTNSSYASFAISSNEGVSFASGAWLCFLGMIAVVVGGVLALRSANKMPQQVAGMGTYTQYPPVAQPPSWSAPVDPYAPIAPPQQQQWNAGQQMPQTQQQQWNTGQQAPPMQQPQWNTGPQGPPTQQQQPPAGPPYQ